MWGYDMKVQTLDMKGFMSHKHTSLTLPEQGLVLIQGPNGGGKSSIPEAISWGSWGETLRGTRPADSGCEVSVKTDSVTVTRKLAKKKASLTWANDGAVPEEYATPTKAQEALEAIIGEHDLWRRTSVFSSQDAAHFTMATDAERKRLLEGILGLDRFDKALERCRADKAVMERTLSSDEYNLGVTRARLEGEQKRLADAKGALASEVPVAAGDAAEELGKLDVAIAHLRVEADQERAALSKMATAGAEYLAEERELRRRLAALDRATCDKCGQPIPRALMETLEVQALGAATSAFEAKSAAAVNEAGHRANLGDIEGQLAQLHQARGGFMARASQAKESQVRIARLTATQEEAEKSVRVLARQVEDVDARVKTASKELAVLKAVEQVLGLRGVRAHVLGRALTGVEHMANVWLGRIAGEGLTLRLTPCVEKKGGGTTDAIGLEVDGAGGGYGYRAASGGERRRIDVALLLALSEVAAAAHGREPGLLVFDEVFDALDDDGVHAVAEVLGELAQERQVLVITHSKTLAEQVPATMRLRVAHGVVEVL